MNRGTLTVVAQAALVGLLVAGIAVFVGLQKTVVLSVDGQQRTVHTYARTVADVLRNEHLVLDEHDTVTPALDSPVSSGEVVAVSRGRELVLSIDGAVSGVWTTAQSVDQALGQLGLHATDAYVSASSTGVIPPQGIDVTVRTPHHVTILVDGRRVVVSSTAATVGALLQQAGIRVGPRDIVTPALVTYPLDGSTVTVSRVSGGRIVAQVAVPYRTVRRPDPNLYKGQTTVVQPGEAGLVVRTYAVTYTDGHITARRLLSSHPKAKPVVRIVEYGTQAPPAGGPVVSIPASGGLNWAALAKCESGGRPRAVSADGLYFGLYQFDLSTWHAWGGTGNPIDASPAQQTYRAQLLYDNRGAEPWPICGRYL